MMSTSTVTRLFVGSLLAIAGGQRIAADGLMTKGRTT